jgi:hypothetical protein
MKAKFYKPGEKEPFAVADGVVAMVGVKLTRPGSFTTSNEWYAAADVGRVEIEGHEAVPVEPDVMKYKDVPVTHGEFLGPGAKPELRDEVLVTHRVPDYGEDSTPFEPQLKKKGGK